MTCKKIQLLLNDYVDDTLPLLHAEVVRNHCDSCAACKKQLEAIRLQKATLASLSVPAASAGFAKKAIANAVKNTEAATKADNGSLHYYKYAAALMLSVMLLWFVAFDHTQVEDKADSLVAVGHEVRTINLAIDSEQSLESVKMRVELSDNLELAGYGNRKQINWTTGLRAGVNVISLPIVGIAQGEGDITTRIQLNGKEKVMRIKTQYKIPGRVYYQKNTVLQG